MKEVYILISYSFVVIKLYSYIPTRKELDQDYSEYLDVPYKRNISKHNCWLEKRYIDHNINNDLNQIDKFNSNIIEQIETESTLSEWFDENRNKFKSESFYTLKYNMYMYSLNSWFSYNSKYFRRDMFEKKYK